MRVSGDMRTGGATGISQHWYENIPWVSLFKAVHHLDIFLAYGDRWRANVSQELRAFVMRGRGRVRVILPDPDNKTAIADLAARFEMDHATIRARIVGAAEEFATLLRGAPSSLAWSIWYLPAAPVYSCYRFDDIVVVAVYRHRRRGSVPMLMAHRGGVLFDFIYEELRAMVTGTEPLARHIAGSSGREKPGA